MKNYNKDELEEMDDEFHEQEVLEKQSKKFKKKNEPVKQRDDRKRDGETEEVEE